MKRSVLFVTAALSFGAAGAQAPVAPLAVQAPALTDVPAGHWAKDAVARLVSEGIILGYPDGTYRGNQTLTRYEAAMIISRLLDRMGNGEVVLDSMDDATVVAVRNAIQELSSQGADLEVRLADLEANAVSRADFARLEGRIDAIAASAAAAPVAPKPSVPVMPSAPVVPAVPTTGVPATGSVTTVDTTVTDQLGDQLATVNELATLLNQDILALQDRVALVDGDLATFDARLGLVEDQVVDNTRLIDAQGLRIANLENGRISLTLGLGAGYGGLKLTEGDTPFDVDRVTNATFINKEFSKDGKEGKTDVVDVNENIPDVGAAITFGVKANDVLVGDNIVIEQAGLNFGFVPANLTGSKKLVGSDDDKDAYVVKLSSAEVTGRVGDEARFRVLAAPGSLKLRPDPHHSLSNLKDVEGYNNYLAPKGAQNGIAAGIALYDVPLKPTLYLAAGLGGKDTLGTFFALRSESEFGDNGLAALSFVQSNANSNAKSDNAKAGRTAIGAEAKYDFDAGNIKFGTEALYVASLKSDIFAKRDTTFGQYLSNRDQAAVFKVKAKTELGPKLSGDIVARAVSPGFAKGVAGIDRKGKTPDYTNEVGLGGRVQADFGTFNAGVYGDTFVPYFGEDNKDLYKRFVNGSKNERTYAQKDLDDDEFFARRTSFGAQAGAGLSGFQVTGFARRTAIGDRVLRYNENHPDFGEIKRGDVIKAGETSKLFLHTSSVGAAITHDGSSKLALVPNLNLTLADAYFYNEGANNFVALAEYDAKLIDGVTLTPFVGYSVLTQSNDSDVIKENLLKSDDNLENLNNFTILKYGLGAETKELDVAFRPKFKASVVNANYGANYNDSNRGSFAGSELAANASVTLKDILGPSAELSLGYGFHQGNNLGYVKDNDNLGSASKDPQQFGFGGTAYAPSNIIKSTSLGDDNSTRTQGFFTQLKWNEALRVNYGIFFYDKDLSQNQSDDVNVAQGFKINYGLKF